MTAAGRESRLGRAFVALADTLISDYDLVELVQTLVDTCVDLLDTTAGGILIADEQRRLQLLASTSESADLIELVQISAQEGPCFDCFASGDVVSVRNIADEADRWPAFRTAALARGFLSVHAIPMRLRSEVIGTMNLLHDQPQVLTESDAAAARALADVATIGILQARLVAQSKVVSGQLQSALNSRVVIEQAKGVLSAVSDLSMDESFRALRAHARRTNTPLSEVAAAVVARTLDVTTP